MPFAERFGVISPRASYMRSVCGCISASSAATEIMNTPRPVETVTRVVVRVTRRRAGPVGHQAVSSEVSRSANRRARGSPFITSDNASTAASCSLDSVAGTSITNR